MGSVRLAAVPGLDRFSAPTRAWFEAAFAEPTAAQSGAWDAITRGSNALVVAPTGSGKTLAAFLSSIDRLLSAPAEQRTPRVLYVSPLKALAVDVERNLRSPLVGIRHAAERLGETLPEVERRRSAPATPPGRPAAAAVPAPDVLITTPESLSCDAHLAGAGDAALVDTVIVDEVHAVAGTKRGTHLALSLERLDALLERPAQRIGLSATVRPVEEVARFLSGQAACEIVAPPSGKEWDLEVVVPVEDMTAPEEYDDESGDPVRASSLWPHVEERIVDLIEKHTTTIVFTNSRRLSERLTARLNEIATERADEPTVLARAHHGSVSKEQRALIEDDLKGGRLPCVVATSSLELGIDMGSVDLVVQVESPPSVASALQRVGRAGHQVGAVAAASSSRRTGPTSSRPPWSSSGCAPA